ncbi:MAG: DUF805 domain-containing protein [Acetobacter sp.]|nr:DUF805 domain-containing protein [Acetobacter sp.]
MDFNSLKDTNNLKALVSGMGRDIADAFKSIKNVNGEKFKAGLNTYFVEYLKNNYAKFDGRVSRRQYWMFTLYSVIISFVIGFIGGLIPFLSIFSLLFAIALLVPSVCLGIRRLHDINLSGWFYLIAFVPFIGGLALLFLFCMPGDAEDNKFGPANK